MTVPLGELARHGHQVTFADAGDNGHPPRITLDMLRGHDLVVAQRWNKHSGLSVWRGAAAWARTVYELDDDVFHVTAENWHAYHLYGRPEVRDAIAHAAETADLVTVTTGPLARVMREYSGNVAVLPNAIPSWVTRLRDEDYGARRRLRVGWQGGASHGVDIGQVASPVRRFLRRFPDWDLQLNGTDYRPTFRVPADRARHVPWIPVHEHPERYFRGIDFDIGLAPLWPTRFAASKSALKAIEYGARGIPCIASDLEPYRDVITHGTDGFLVRGDDAQRRREWHEYLCLLASDDGLREKMGRAARQMARRHLIEDLWKNWETAYKGLFRR